MHVGGKRSFQHESIVDFSSKTGNVLPDRAVEQRHVLGQVSDMAAQVLGLPFGRRVAVKPDRAALRCPDTGKHLRQCRLAGGARPDHRNRIPGLQVHADIGQGCILCRRRPRLLDRHADRHLRPRQLKPSLTGRKLVNKFLQLCIRSRRGQKAAPLPDQLVNRSEGPAEHDGCRNHDTG